MKISSDFLAKIGYPLIFENISYVEVLNTLQYDPHHFFLLAKISFKPGFGEDQWQELFRDHKIIRLFYPLRKAGNEILCLMGLSRDTAFWPALPVGHWAIVPPVILDPESSHFMFIVDEESQKQLLDTLSKYADSAQILAMADIEKSIPTSDMLMPNFTTRQREIAQYAIRNGYLEMPKRITAKKIAEHFGISVSAMNEHLRKVEGIALRYFFS